MLVLHFVNDCCRVEEERNLPQRFVLSSRGGNFISIISSDSLSTLLHSQKAETNKSFSSQQITVQTIKCPAALTSIPEHEKYSSLSADVKSEIILDDVDEFKNVVVVYKMITHQGGMKERAAAGPAHKMSRPPRVSISRAFGHSANSLIILRAITFVTYYTCASGSFFAPAEIKSKQPHNLYQYVNTLGLASLVDGQIHFFGRAPKVKWVKWLNAFMNHMLRLQHSAAWYIDR